MDKFKNKYRSGTTRLKNWDYGWNAVYFVTLCTKNRQHFFGTVIPPGNMQLSKIGEIVEQCWLEIPEHFPFVKLGGHIVMPDHMHGIIIINKPDTKKSRRIPSPNTFGPQSQNLASIVRGFKVGVTKYARKINPEFAWQSRYYDRIIRDKQSYDHVVRYIQNNPKKWFDGG